MRLRVVLILGLSLAAGLFTARPARAQGQAIDGIIRNHHDADVAVRNTCFNGVNVGITQAGRHHDACRRMVESLTERVPSREGDCRCQVFVLTKAGTVGRKSMGQNTQEVRR